MEVADRDLRHTCFLSRRPRHESAPAPRPRPAPVRLAAAPAAGGDARDRAARAAAADGRDRGAPHLHDHGPGRHDGVRAGARGVERALAGAAGGALVARSPRARVAVAVRDRLPLGRRDRVLAVDAAQYADPDRHRAVGRAAPGGHAAARRRRVADDRRADRRSPGRGIGQGRRARAALSPAARRVRQHARRLRLRGAGRRGLQLGGVRALHRAGLRAVRRRPVGTAARRALCAVRPRRPRALLGPVRRVPRARPADGQRLALARAVRGTVPRDGLARAQQRAAAGRHADPGCGRHAAAADHRGAAPGGLRRSVPLREPR